MVWLAHPQLLTIHVQTKGSCDLNELHLPQHRMLNSQEITTWEETDVVDLIVNLDRTQGDQIFEEKQIR